MRKRRERTVFIDANKNGKLDSSDVKIVTSLCGTFRPNLPYFAVSATRNGAAVVMLDARSTDSICTSGSGFCHCFS